MINARSKAPSGEDGEKRDSFLLPDCTPAAGVQTAFFLASLNGGGSENEARPPCKIRRTSTRSRPVCQRHDGGNAGDIATL